MLTEKQIKFLNRACPNIWTEENGIVNVNGNVNMSKMQLTKIPVQFGRVKDNFECYDNELTSLKGSPSIIEGHFNCNLNQLTALTEGPKEVLDYYSCDQNRLTSLIGAPKTCNNDFYCQTNLLTTLEGCPKLIVGELFCENNPNLKYLWGIGQVEDTVNYSNKNDLNKWILSCMRKNIIFPHATIEENINWIKHEQKYSLLLMAPEEIRKYFSPRILNLVDTGSYNESKILDYKNFARLC